MNNPKTYEECLLYMEHHTNPEGDNTPNYAWMDPRHVYAVSYIEDYEKALRTITLATDILNSPEYQEMWKNNSDTSIQNAIKIIGEAS